MLLLFESGRMKTPYRRRAADWGMRVLRLQGERKIKMVRTTCRL
jgi:hypothetical protein